MRSCLFFFLVLLIFFGACEDDQFETSLSTGDLEFSKDTIYLDTVFTNTSSSTRSFKVYNRSSQHISIPAVRLQSGDASNYRLNVNGVPGKQFENVSILPRDSIYIFVEVTADANNLADPIYTDKILFDEGDRQQEVELVTLVQDAHFLYPKRDANGVKESIEIGIDENGDPIEVVGFYLEGDIKWTSDKPYVIYGYAAIKEGGSLTIDKGAQIHFHQNSGLIIEKNSQLLIEGELDDPVLFQGDRLEPFFEEIPGQWGMIWLRAGSNGHRLNNVMIKNSTVGVFVESVGNDHNLGLELSNVEIYNTSSHGLLARGASIKGANVVIGNTGQSAMACVLGGNYEFIHSTLSSFWLGPRLYPALYISNYDLGAAGSGDSNSMAPLKSARFVNCIVDGSRDREFLLEAADGMAFDFQFSHSLLRYGGQSTDPLYDFDNENLYHNVQINSFTDFLDISSNNYQIGSASEAINAASIEGATIVPVDLNGQPRLPSPDSGAYQHKEE